MLLTPAQIKLCQNRLNRGDGTLYIYLFFYPGLMFTCVLGRYVASTVILVPKLQALVYYILPGSTTAVFSYVIGSRKLSDNEQFFVG